MSCLSSAPRNCWICCTYSTLAFLTLLLSQSAAGPFCSKTKVGCLLSLLLFCSLYFAPRGMCSLSQLWALWKLWGICVLCLLLNPGHDQEEFYHAGPMACSAMGGWYAVLSVAVVTHIFLGFCRDIGSGFLPSGTTGSISQEFWAMLFPMHGFVSLHYHFSPKAVQMKSWSLVLCWMQMASSRPMVPALVSYEDLLGAFKQFWCPCSISDQLNLICRAGLR